MNCFRHYDLNIYKELGVEKKQATMSWSGATNLDSSDIKLDYFFI